jgi:hypothetical protein
MQVIKKAPIAFLCFSNVIFSYFNTSPHSPSSSPQIRQNNIASKTPHKPTHATFFLHFRPALAAPHINKTTLMILSSSSTKPSHSFYTFIKFII